MTITYNLAPEPIWTLINLEGTVAGGAYLFTYRSLNKIQQKPVYQDPLGNEPWTNPIVFNLNGTQGPFYFETDSTDLEDTYYLEAWSADPRDPLQGAILLWTIDNFAPGSSGGGGGGTEYIQFQNYIANNQFINQIGSTDTTNITNIVVAPSNHKGFTPAASNPLVATNGVVGPDIRFLKSSTANTDNISFPTFPLSSAPLLPDVTPAHYLRYQCTTSNPGEVYKCFQFPITQKVKNLSNQVMTFKIWAAVSSVDAAIQPYIRQYYGSGSAATAEVLTAIGSPLALTTTWTPFFSTFTVPDVSGNSLGTPGRQTDDDAIYIQLMMPINSACDIFFTKPALYLGNIQPSQDFEDYDQIDSINSTPRTGDIRVSLTPSAPPGWLPMNDGTIGNTGSGATLAAGDYVFQLYSTIYTSVIDTWAPVSGGRTAPGNTMTTAITDFIAGKTLTLPLSLGRALAGAGAGAGLTSRALGENLGEESHTMTIGELATHRHSPLAPGTGFITNSSGSGNTTTGSNIGNVASTADTGSSTPFNVMQPTSFMNIFIKL